MAEVTLDSSVDELELPVRAWWAFKDTGVHTIRQLLQVDPRLLLRQRNCGKKTLKAIREAVHEHGWRLADEMAAATDAIPSLQAERAAEIADAIKRAATAARVLGDALWRVGEALEPKTSDSAAEAQS